MSDKIVACDNLGSDFNKRANPIQVNIDNSTIIRNPDGTLEVDVAAVCAVCDPTGISAECWQFADVGDGWPAAAQHGGDPSAG